MEAACGAAQYSRHALQQRRPAATKCNKYIARASVASTVKEVQTTRAWSLTVPPGAEARHPWNLQLHTGSNLHIVQNSDNTLLQLRVHTQSGQFRGQERAMLCGSSREPSATGTASTTCAFTTGIAPLGPIAICEVATPGSPALVL